MCVLCTVGHYCLEGASEPLPCRAGTFSNASGVANASLCTSCPTGAFCVAGSVSPISCSAGSFAESERSPLCTTCDEGFYQDAEGATACKRCPHRHTCPRGSSTPLPATCKPGTFAANSSIATATLNCSSCNMGFECPGGTAPAQPCRPGSIAPDAATPKCSLCDGGKFQNASGATSCTACAQGSYCAPGSPSPLPCAEGTYTNSTNLKHVDECTVAEPGFYSPVGSRAQMACAPGTFAPSESGSCSKCAAGRYQGAEQATACKQCTLGHYCEEAASAPLPCPGGTHQNASLEVMTSAAQCVSCPEGTFCTIGSAAPTPCAAGTFSPSANATQCTTCDAGTFANTTRATACFHCTEGHWCTNEAQIPCSENTYNPNPLAHLVTNCSRCPERTTTLEKTARTTEDDCSCNEEYYYAPASFAAGRKECLAQCCTCPIGTKCNHGSIRLGSLPVSPGYFRLASDSVDVRRCPDAAANCSGRSECPWTTSGCVGGSHGSLCQATLTGAFCQRCIEPSHFYKRATAARVAHCEPCSQVTSSGAVIMLIIACSTFVSVVVALVGLRWVPTKWKAAASRGWSVLCKVYGLPTKLKILIGFYQIATRVESVYGILLPDNVRSLLLTLQFSISLGFDGIPLACVGAGGYLARLIFWMVAPLAVVAAAAGAIVGHTQLVGRGRVPFSMVLDRTAPTVLRTFFLSYPIVTNVAFEAFSCFEFEDGDGYLKADVSIRCGSAEHHEAKTLATFAVIIYPVGLFVLNGMLLYGSRQAILSEQPSTLSRATTFLHWEYKPLPYLYAWELMEMGRRFSLVGVFVVGPFHSGSMMQLALAAITCVLYLVIQMQAMPYRSHTDNFLAVGGSLSLVVLFVASTFYKVAALTELQGIKNRMSHELKEDYELSTLTLTFLLVASVVGSLILMAILTVMQAAQHTRDLEQQRRAAKARRLRYTSANDSRGEARSSCGDDSESANARAESGSPGRRRSSAATTQARFARGGEVIAPTLGDNDFHLFLSHVWGTGQDQMRVIKQRLLEMLPDLSVFLDVDDLQDISNLPGYVARTRAVLVFCSEGYFKSKNCMIELRSAVQYKKPIIALLDPDRLRGGLSIESVHEQLLEADARCSSWGFDKGPYGATLFDALFNAEPIEWNRIGHFQDVTLRQIAERLLPVGHPRTYVQGEIVSQPMPALPPPRHRSQFHVYCSPNNAGAADVVMELGAALSKQSGTARIKRSRSMGEPSYLKQDEERQVVCVTEEPTQLERCECMLVYLNAWTWTRDQTSAQFAEEVLRAMALSKRLVLAHEMIGVGGSEARGGCEFSTFFATTPAELLRAGIYDKIAVALKGGAWREASMHLLCRALAEEPPTLSSQGVSIRRGLFDWFSSSSLPQDSPSAVVQDTAMVPVDPTVQPARRPKRRFDPQRFSRAAEPILFRLGQIGQAHEERFPKEPAARPSGSALFVDREARGVGGGGGRAGAFSAYLRFPRSGRVRRALIPRVDANRVADQSGRSARNLPCDSGRTLNEAGEPV